MSKELNSGLVYLNGSSGIPKDVLTWHLSGNYRIWLHARIFDGSGYRPVSVEVEWVGNQFSEDSITEMDLRLRLELATSKRTAGSLPDFQSSLFREIPIGKIIEEHASIISSQKMNAWDEPRGRVNIVSHFTSKVFSEKEINKLIVPSNHSSTLRAKSTDAIVIAKVYAEQSESGHKRPAKKVAELLNLETSIVYVAVRIARKNGWLTSQGSGSSGGSLTDEGQRMFVAVNGKQLLKDYLRKDH